MRTSTLAVLSTAIVWSLSAPAGAASLQVAPVSVEVAAPSASTIVTLRNEGTRPLVAQIRVFRWFQVNGEEKLEPTDDVVASPPITSLAPKTDYTVRLVRVAKRPLSAGESYRLLVDELPDRTAERTGVVSLVLRYSIPVFFYSGTAAEAKLTWSLERRGGQIYVSATNAGDRHSRISALKIRDEKGSTVSFGNGLTGYALGRSTIRWALPGNTRALSRDGSIVIDAQGTGGPIHATTTPLPR